MEEWTYVQTVNDVMATKPRFLASMGYHIFLTMVIRARGAPLVSLTTYATNTVGRFPVRSKQARNKRSMSTMLFGGTNEYDKDTK